MEQQTRTCKDCSTCKSLSDFSGRNTVCKSCKSNYDKTRYQQQKTSVKKCNKCQEDKPCSEYTGKYSICKLCRAKNEKHKYHQRKTMSYVSNQRKKCKTCELTKLIDQYSGTNMNCNACERVYEKIRYMDNLRAAQKQKIIREIPTRDTNEFTGDSVSTHVYLLTSGIFDNQRFKIGIHTGDLSKLKSRYKTYFGDDVEVIRFIRTKNSIVHEKNLHQILSEHRYQDTEWFILKRDEIAGIFDKYVKNNISVLDQYEPQHGTAKEQMIIFNLVDAIKSIDQEQPDLVKATNCLKEAQFWITDICGKF